MINRRNLGAGVLVDIDGTLTHLAIIDSYARFLGRPAPVRHDEVTTYNLDDFFGVTPEQADEFWRNHELDSYKDDVPQVGSVRVLTGMVDSLINVEYITARGGAGRDVTSSWLMTKGYPAGLLLMDAHDKAALAVERNLGLAIEDSPANALALADAGIPVILMDWAYNRHVSHPLVHRAYSWPDVHDYIFKRKLRVA